MDRVKIANIKDFFKEPSALANKLVEVEKSKEGVFDVFVLQAIQSSVPVMSSTAASTLSENNNNENNNSDNEAAIISPSSTATSATAYTIEYKVDSSRGQNHYLVKVTVVVDRRLLVATVQTRDEDYSTLTSEATRTLDSLMVSSPPSSTTM
jgi:hypothetical protein